MMGMQKHSKIGGKRNPITTAIAEREDDDDDSVGNDGALSLPSISQETSELCYRQEWL